VRSESDEKCLSLLGQPFARHPTNSNFAHTQAPKSGMSPARTYVCLWTYGGSNETSAPFNMAAICTHEHTCERPRDNAQRRHSEARYASLELITVSNFDTARPKTNDREDPRLPCDLVTDDRDAINQNYLNARSRQSKISLNANLDCP
jgi:hypothetical protein